jgi:AcrR family transcriptional regulator
MDRPHRSTAPRSRGRPGGDAANQRHALLDAAIALFGQRGIAATPLSAIARQAHVTPALLHYYFGNREKLVEAVVEERLMPLVGPVMAGVANLDADADPRKALPQLAGDMIRIIAAAPWLPPLWVREILCEGGQLREALLSRVAPGVAIKVAALTRRGQAAGLVNPDLEPQLLLATLIGLTIFMLAAAPIWRRLPGSADIDTEALTRHVLALLRSGLEPPHAITP